MNADTLVRRYEKVNVKPSGQESSAVVEWLKSMTFEEFKVAPFPFWMTKAEQLDCILYLRAVRDGRMNPIFSKPSLSDY
jgi:hypothetical protein